MAFFLLRNVSFGLEILRTRLYLEILLNGRTSLFKFKPEITLMSKYLLKTSGNILILSFDLVNGNYPKWWLPKVYSCIIFLSGLYVSMILNYEKRNIGIYVFLINHVVDFFSHETYILRGMAKQIALRFYTVLTCCLSVFQYC